MVRRVGFGDPAETHPAGPGGSGEPDVLVQVAKPLSRSQRSGDAGGAGKMPAWAARLIGVPILLGWIAGWGYGMLHALRQVTALPPGPDAFEIVWAAFHAVWGGGAVLAFSFGVVLLFVLVFGKPGKDTKSGDN